MVPNPSDGSFPVDAAVPVPGGFMRVIDLKQKEVINTCTCKSLGCPVDVEFHPSTGQITELIVPGPGRFCGCFGRDSEFCIPWKCIRQIGEDIILVEIQEDRCIRKF